MTPQDWWDWAKVYRAGAACSARWNMSIERQQEAEILRAMADQCEANAAARNAPSAGGGN